MCWCAEGRGNRRQCRKKRSRSPVLSDIVLIRCSCQSFSMRDAFAKRKNPSRNRIEMQATPKDWLPVA